MVTLPINVTWSDAENWVDLIDHLWIGIVMIMVAAVPSLLAMRNHKSIKDETTVIKEQLVNGHPSPLRADMDKALLAINSLTHSVADLRDNVAALRDDLLVERDSRRAQVDDLRSDVDRMQRRANGRQGQRRAEGADRQT